MILSGLVQKNHLLGTQAHLIIQWLALLGLPACPDKVITVHNPAMSAHLQSSPQYSHQNTPDRRSPRSRPSLPFSRACPGFGSSLKRYSITPSFLKKGIRKAPVSLPTDAYAYKYSVSLYPTNRDLPVVKH